MQSGPAFIEAFLSVLRGVTKEETVQYVLATLLELLAGTSTIASFCSTSMCMASCLAELTDPCCSATFAVQAFPCPE
jgi:hypothetical protein